MTHDQINPSVMYHGSRPNVAILLASAIPNPTNSHIQSRSNVQYHVCCSLQLHMNAVPNDIHTGGLMQAGTICYLERQCQCQCAQCLIMPTNISMISSPFSS